MCAKKSPGGFYPSVKVPAGTYFAERVPVPISFSNQIVNWLVILGFDVGASEKYLKDWGPEYGDFEIVVTEK